MSFLCAESSVRHFLYLGRNIPGGGVVALVRAVALSYKVRFRQEAMLHESGPVCAGLQ